METRPRRMLLKGNRTEEIDKNRFYEKKRQIANYRKKGHA
jgi:hypothetical protein